MNENIAIITGGDSSERDVSLQTANAIAESFRKQNITHAIFIVANFEDFIHLDLNSFSRVFLALHGGFGENGMAQAYLEGIGKPFNGPSFQTSSICMDKRATKHIAKSLGVSVANYMFFTGSSDIDFESVKHHLGHTLIVKPNREGCSFGVSLIHDNPHHFHAAVTKAEAYQSGILIEEFISGQELSVCYYHGNILPIYSLDFETDFFSYDAKFKSTKTTATLITLDDECYRKLSIDCHALAKTLDLDYFRADIIVRDSTPYLLELNTLPGLTSHSLFPKACKEGGISFDSLVLHLNSLTNNGVRPSNHGNIP